MAGIYISFPFCEQKCTYCNFASGVFPRSLIGPYLEALRAEIRAARFPSEPDTLYLGGGTPSLLEPEPLAHLLGALPRCEWREATLEASPGTVSPEKAAAWARLGIRRVSLGVQSFVPRVAAAAGRKHTPQQVAGEIAWLHQAGVRSINLDLIAGLAHQNVQTWNQDLDWVERLQPEHVSVYMLEVDDDSRLGGEIRRGGGRYGAGAVPAEEEIADFYLLAVERLRQMGIWQYEISNFCRPGCESIHNLKYWNMAPYLGFGAAAHSYDGCRRWSNVSSPAEYVARWQRGDSVIAESEDFDPARRLQERLFTGLRQVAGIAVSDAELAPFEEPLARLTEQRWVERTGDGHLRLTPAGVMFANEVFEQFL